MCNCSVTSTGARASTSKVCETRIANLKDARNKLATLFNFVSDPVLKAKYKLDRDSIDAMISQQASTGVCPEHELVTNIVNEVDNEYNKYY